MVEGDPDLDAIFRLTRKGSASVFNVTFDPVSPPVFLPAGMYSPINSQNTMFLRKAFWALLLPTTTAFRVCDIWRGYWAQRLLWEIGGSLGIPTANARQSRNVHSYLSDALDETQMYFHTDRLLAFLTSWSCPRRLTFFACIVRLSFDMAKEGFWGKEDAENTHIWLEDLLSIGYRQPKRVLLRSKQPRSRKSLTSTAVGKDTKTSFALFVPVDREAPSLSRLKEGHTSSSTTYLNQLASACPDLPMYNLTYLKQPYKGNYFFRDVLLIIIFNFPYYSNNLRYTEAAYRSSFTNIVYCGSWTSFFRNASQDIGLDLTFIEADIDKGKLGYDCLIKAIEAGFRVSGYLVVGDDVLVNFWSFGGFDKTKIWAATKRVHPVKTRGPEQHWLWWNNSYGRQAWTEITSELSKRQLAPEGITLPTDFRKTFWNNIPKMVMNPKPGKVIRGMSDIYYVPARFASSARWYLTLFLKHRLFLEIAVPRLLFGLQDLEEIETLNGTYLWKEKRLDTWKFFDPHHHYLHPVKFSWQENQNGFCSHFAPLLMKPALGIDDNFITTLNYTDTSRGV